MKPVNRVLSVILCMLILMSVFMSAPFTVNAADDYTFEENGIRYLELDDSTLSVVGFKQKNKSEELVIPKTAGGKAVTQIGESAFAYDSKLKKVTVEADITTIGDYAFQHCTSFTKINLPDSLTYIGQYAFRGCTLISIQLPKKLETISTGAFKSCRIKQLTIPANVKTIGASAFSSNYYLTDVVIEKRDDLLDLEDFVFSSCKELKTFDFTYCGKIGEQSFFGCSSLTSITLPSHIDITSAVGAFRGCSNLKTVNLPDNINSIPKQFLNSCKSLENINTSKITSIGDYAFGYCESITDFDFTSCNKIGVNSFISCKGITTITLPDNMDLTNADSAFVDCTNLKTVNLADTIDAIPSGFFHGCTNLENIDFSKITNVGRHAFFGCKSITTVDFSNDAVVGEGAFYGCTSLTDFDFSNCTDIGEDAFSGCTGFTSVKVDHLTSIPKNAFKGCSKITDISIANCTDIGEGAFSACKSLETLELPENLITVGSKAFMDCTSLKKVTINPQLKTIGSSAFAQNVALTEVVFKERTTPVSINAQAFFGCTGITDFDFSICSYIGGKAFTGTSITNVVMPKDAEVKLADSAFKECTTLETIVLADSITIIPASCFYDCENLKKIETSNKITEVGNSAFYNCKNLVDMSFAKDNDITSVANKAFYNCHSLTEISLLDTKHINGDAFMNCCNLRKVETSQALKSVGYSAFYNCEMLEEIVLTNVETISDQAFKNCYSLKKAETSEALEYMEEEAFFNCEMLEEICLTGVKTIRESTFENCYSLEKVAIGEKLERIYAYAFFNCVSLTEFYIPESVETIESYALACFEYDGKTYVNTNFVVRGSDDSLADEFARAYGVKKGLPAPVLKSVSNVKAGIKVSFKKVSGETGKYRVYRKTEGSSWKKLADVTGSSYTDTTAKVGTKYTYTVKLITSKETSPYDTKGLSTVRLSTPEISKITNVNDGMKISWNKSSGASSYIVYVKNGDDWEEIGETTSTSMTFSGFYYRPLVPGKNYSFTLKSVDSTGKYKSGCVTAGWKNKYIASPQITKLSNTETGVKITWDKVAGAEKYRVFVKSGSSWKKLKDTTSTSYTHTSAKSGETYVYTVRCISSTGKSYKSGYDTKGNTMFFLATPVVKSISNTVDGAKITYTAVNGAGKYNIYAKSGSSWKKIGESETNTFVHEDAKSGTTYSYRVRAYDDMLEYSSYYKTSEKNTFIAAPVISGLSNTSKGVKITWDKVAGAENYRVFVKSGSKWKKLKDTTATSYTHTGAKSGETYTYTVRCISSTGKSYKSGYDTVGKSIVFEK